MINMAMWRGMNCSYALIRKISSVFGNASRYRTGGDEFVILCQDSGQEEFLEKTAQLKCIFREENGDIAAVGVNWTQKGQFPSEGNK